MKRIIHQWRDWLLELTDDDKYELTRKDNSEPPQTIMAKNAMDAETACQKIIQKRKADAA